MTAQAPELVPVSPDAGYAPEFAVTVEGQPVDELDQERRGRASGSSGTSTTCPAST